MSTVRMNFEISGELANRLSAHSKQSERSASAMVEEALTDFLARETSYAQKLDAIAADTKTGPVVKHSAIMSWLESWGTDQEGLAPIAQLRD